MLLRELPPGREASQGRSNEVVDGDQASRRTRGRLHSPSISAFCFCASLRAPSGEVFLCLIPAFHPSHCDAQRDPVYPTAQYAFRGAVPGRFENFRHTACARVEYFAILAEVCLGTGIVTEQQENSASPSKAPLRLPDFHLDPADHGRFSGGFARKPVVAVCFRSDMPSLNAWQLQRPSRPHLCRCDSLLAIVSASETIDRGALPERIPANGEAVWAWQRFTFLLRRTAWSR